MKTILVIELPENLNKVIDEIRVDIKADLYGNELLDWRNQSLKPIPSKKEITVEMMWNSKYEAEALYYAGFNACIDELLGETEE